MATAVKRSEKRLGQILVDQETITEEQLDKALEEHSKSGKKLGEVQAEHANLTTAVVGGGSSGPAGIALATASASGAAGE